MTVHSTIDAAPAETASQLNRFWRFACRAVWMACYALVGIVLFALAAVAALRIFDHDGSFVLIWLNAFTTYIYLPAYLCLTWAVWQRRWLLAAIGAFVVICHLSWIAPDFFRDRRFDVSAGAVANKSARTVRIFFANVASDNTEYQAMFGEIAAADPDVMEFAEFGPQWRRAFEASPIAARYKYGSPRNEYGIGSVIVYSKLPVKAQHEDWLGNRGVRTLDLDVDGRELRLVSLHAPRPVDSPKYDYLGFWNPAVEMLTNQVGPLVIVGDFGATQHARVYGELTKDRLRSAHEDRGRGYATTWPNGRLSLPPVRIDHVLLSPEVECVEVMEGIGRGSDHKPVVLDVRLRGTAPALDDP